MIINKKKKRTCKIVDFALPADQRIKLKESEKKDKYLDLFKGTVGVGNWRTSEDHPNYSIIENSQNTEKSSGDLRRLAVT